MNDDQIDEQHGLIDDDPALDYILYREIEEKDRRPGNHGGCLTLVLFLLVPTTGMYLLTALLEKI